MKRKVSNFVYWAPRVMSILLICFLALFSLDVFDGNYGFWGTIVGLFIHNIPVFILIIVLVIAWKREIVGAIAFALAGLLYILQMVVNALQNSAEWYMLSWSVIIAGPAFLIGYLFYLNWSSRKRGIKRLK